MMPKLNKKKFKEFCEKYKDDIDKEYILIDVITHTSGKNIFIYTLINVNRNPLNAKENKSSSWKDGVNLKLKDMGFFSNFDSERKFKLFVDKNSENGIVIFPTMIHCEVKFPK